MSKDNVTDVDALDQHKEDNPDKVVVVPNPRDAVFNSIENRRALEMKQNMLDNEIDPEEIKRQMEGIVDVMEPAGRADTGLDGDEDEEDKTTQASPQSKEVEDKDKQAQPKTYKLVIDGVEEILTEDQLQAKIAAVQKSESADRRFEKLAEERKKFDQERADFTTKQEKQAKQLEKLEQDAKVTLNPDMIKKVVHLIREGEGDSAELALQELINTTTTNPNVLTKDQVESYLDQRIQKEKQVLEEQGRKAQEEALTKSIVEAERQFEEKFAKQIGDRKEDSEFYDLALIKYQRIAKDPDWNSKPFIDQFTHAGEMAMKQLGLDKVDTLPVSDKQKLKDNITSTKSAGLKSTQRTDEEKYKSRSDIVNEMKQSRGQV